MCVCARACHGGSTWPLTAIRSVRSIKCVCVCARRAFVGMSEKIMEQTHKEERRQPFHVGYALGRHAPVSSKSDLV